jgi:hypothetical protein
MMLTRGYTETLVHCYQNARRNIPVTLNCFPRLRDFTSILHRYYIDSTSILFWCYP